MQDGADHSGLVALASLSPRTANAVSSFHPSLHELATTPVDGRDDLGLFCVSSSLLWSIAPERHGHTSPGLGVGALCLNLLHGRQSVVLFHALTWDCIPLEREFTWERSRYPCVIGSVPDTVCGSVGERAQYRREPSDLESVLTTYTIPPIRSPQKYIPLSRNALRSSNASAMPSCTGAHLLIQLSK